MKRKIIAVFKTHFDIGFTQLSSEVINRYSTTMLGDVIKTCRATEKLGNNKYVWTMSAWPLKEALCHASKEDRVEAERLIANGQLTTHALPFTTHTEFLGLEELCRMFVFAKQFSKTYGVSMPITAKMTDVPGHTWALVSVLAMAGVKFLHLGCNSASLPPDVPQLFWWEAPDGKRVLTMYNKGGYGSSLLPPKDWKLDIWPAIIQSNDNIGPQDENVITLLKDSLKDVDEQFDFSVGTLDTVYKQLIKNDLSALPVIRKDLADTWIHGVGTYPKEVAELRRNRSRLLSYEKLLNIMTECGERGFHEFSQIVSRANENALLFGEHTWGLDVKTTLGYNRYYNKKAFVSHLEDACNKRIMESWQEQRQREENAVAETDKLEKMLAAHFDGTGKKNGLAIFNPCAASFTGYIDITDFTAIDGLQQDGKHIPVLQASGKRYAHVQGVPPLGTITLASAEQLAETVNISQTAERIIMQNGILVAEFDRESGTLTSLIDTTTGKNWAKKVGMFDYDVIGSQDITDYLKSYVYRFYDWSTNDFGRMGYPVNFEHYSTENVCSKISVDGNSVIVELIPADQLSVSEYGNAEKVVLTYTLLGDALNLWVDLKNKPATPMIEGGHMVFDFGIPNPTYTINKVGSVLNPETDIQKDANNILYCLENWVDVSDGKDGICVVSHDAPLFSIGEQAIYKYQNVYQPHSGSKLYFNLFNNMWGTNFPQWTSGDFSFAFDFVPHAGSVLNSVDQLDRLVHPPIAFYSDGKRCVGKYENALQVSGASVVAIKSSEESGIVLRLKEEHGKPAVCELSGSMVNGKKVFLSDLLENERCALKAVNEKYHIGLGAFEITTVLIQ